MKYTTAYIFCLLTSAAALTAAFGHWEGLLSLLVTSTPGAIIYLAGVRDFKSWRWMDKK